MVAVVDYGMGNLRSLAKALEAVGAEVCVSADPAVFRRADRIVLPGVGAFGQCVFNLRRSGLIDALESEVRVRRKPFLGVCLGMQVLATEGYEHGIHAGLDWVPGVVRSFREDRQVRVPHVGWNEVVPLKQSPLFAGLRAESTFYFAHSFHFVCQDPKTVAAECDYGGTFTVAVQQENLFAIQFHPEKSQDQGLRLLRNFLEWEPQ